MSDTQRTRLITGRSAGFGRDTETWESVTLGADLPARS